MRLLFLALALPGIALAEPAPTDPLVKQGEALYTRQVCSACHSIDGSPRAAPTLKGLWGKKQKLKDGSSVLVDAAYVKRSLLEPGAQVVEGFQPGMPSYQLRLKPEEIDALVAFVKSLK